MRLNETPLPGGGATGLGSVKAIPAGCVPDQLPASPTAEVKPSTEVTVQVLVALASCSTINDEGSHSRTKSDLSESLATLLVEGSSTHVSPDASTTRF